MTGVLPSWRSPKGAVEVMAVEQLPCSPKEDFSKEECPSSDLWEPRMLQRIQLVSQLCKSPVLELLPPGLQCLQPAGVLRMIQTAVEPHSRNCRGCRDPPCQTSLGLIPPAVLA